MANTFIVSGNLPDAQEVKPMATIKRVPGFLYHSTAPRGESIDSEEEYDRRLKLGWVEHWDKIDEEAEKKAEAKAARAAKKQAEEANNDGK